jgi:taspase, threonine aspartase, 1
MLASHGAISFALRANCQIVSAESLITPESRADWETWSRRVDREKHEGMEDTVGCVAMDQHYSLAAGVSSGGILLKQPGRLGEVGVVVL